MGGEIDAKALQCNACWKSIVGVHDKSYKTSCAHLYCPPCAERHFSVKMVCPLCEASIAGPGDIVELSHGEDLDAALVATFTLACINIDDAMRMIHEAVIFCRNQTALSGTREIWVRTRECDNVKKQLVQTENSLNTTSLNLHNKTKEVQDLTAKLGAKLHHVEELERKLLNLEAVYNSLKSGGDRRVMSGGTGGTATGAHGAAGPGSAGAVGYGGYPMSFAPAMTPNSSHHPGGGGLAVTPLRSPGGSSGGLMPAHPGNMMQGATPARRYSNTGIGGIGGNPTPSQLRPAAQQQAQTPGGMYTGRSSALSSVAASMGQQQHQAQRPHTPPSAMMMGNGVPARITATPSVIGPGGGSMISANGQRLVMSGGAYPTAGHVTGGVGAGRSGAGAQHLQQLQQQQQSGPFFGNSTPGQGAAPAGGSFGGSFSNTSVSSAASSVGGRPWQSR